MRRLAPALVVTFGVATAEAQCPPSVSDGGACGRDGEVCRVRAQNACGLNGYRCVEGHWRAMRRYCNPPRYPDPQESTCPPPSRLRAGAPCAGRGRRCASRVNGRVTAVWVCEQGRWSRGDLE